MKKQLNTAQQEMPDQHSQFNFAEIFITWIIFIAMLTNITVSA